MLLDIGTLLIEEVTGQLKVATDDEPTPAQNMGDKLLLTEEQWLAHSQERQRGEGSSGKCPGKLQRRSSGGRTSTAPGCEVKQDECRTFSKSGH